MKRMCIIVLYFYNFSNIYTIICTAMVFFFYIFHPQLVLLLSFPFVFEDEKKSLGICALLLFNHSPSGTLVKWENVCKINKEIQRSTMESYLFYVN